MYTYKAHLSPFHASSISLILLPRDPHIISYKPSMDGFFSLPPFFAAPHNVVDGSHPPSKRKRLDPAPQNSATRGEAAQSVADDAYLFLDPSLYHSLFDYTLSAPTNDDIVESSYQASATTAGGIEALLHGITPRFPPDASERPSKRRRVHNARPSGSVISENSTPGDTTYSAHVFPFPTPTMATGSLYDESFVEGSSKDAQTPNAILGATAARPPPPEAFGAPYRYHNAGESFDSLFGEDPQLSLPFSGFNFSADEPPASGVPHGLPSLPSHTAPPPRTKYRILEDGPPEAGVSFRQHKTGVVTYFDPHRASSPLPDGTKLQLACRNSQKPKDKHVRCLYHDPFDDKVGDCNDVLVNFGVWKKHFWTHAMAEKLYVDDHQDKSQLAVALKDPSFVHAAAGTWKCEICGRRGRKSNRTDALGKHQKDSKKCAKIRKHKLLNEQAQAGGSDWGQFGFVPPVGVDHWPLDTSSTGHNNDVAYFEFNPFSSF